MAVRGGTLRLQTEGNGQVVDLTAGVRQIINTAGVERGLVCVAGVGPRLAVTTIEQGSDGSELQQVLDYLCPDAGGRAQLRAAIIGPSLSLPVIDRGPALADAQQIVLIDFGDVSRQCTVIVEIVS